MAKSEGNLPPARVVGLMSGTSVDSIDVAVAQFSEEEEGEIVLQLLGYQEQPVDKALRSQIFAACTNQIGVAELCELNFWVGRAFGEATLAALKQLGIAPAEIDLIASHGQTIYHQIEAGHRRSSWQTGEAAEIAAVTGCTVASNFRVADVSAGGQGAPLVSYFDYLFLQNPNLPRGVLNIGGIANITYLPASHRPDKIYAFDTGPGNMLIDYAVRQFTDNAQGYDKDGAMAQAGEINQELLNELLQTPYLKQKPPKTSGRELFGDAFVKKVLEIGAARGIPPADMVATLTAFTARSIAQAHQDFGPAEGMKELIVSGGGARNPALLAELADSLPGVRLRLHDEFGLAAECKEAVAFALFGYELLRGRAANLPTCTGAVRPTLLGQLTPGFNFSSLLKRFAPFMSDESSLIQNEDSEKRLWQPKRSLILKK